MKTQTSYRYIQDPGHGWIEVPRAELDALEIAHRVSLYSYQLGPWVYLEEDCDAGLWIGARAAQGFPVGQDELHEEHTDTESFIRDLERYRPSPNLRAQTAARTAAAVAAEDAAVVAAVAAENAAYDRALDAYDAATTATIDAHAARTNAAEDTAHAARAAYDRALDDYAHAAAAAEDAYAVAYDAAISRAPGPTP
jgi:hypothetical protein